VPDDLAVVIMALTVLSAFYAFDITRIARGAPHAWYFIIGGFIVFFAYRAVDLYSDIQVPKNTLDIPESLISLLAGALFLVGLIMLDLRFRAQQKAAQGS
jgi:RsiW-degrading membrane proteinase PrsW (M82 family)